MSEIHRTIESFLKKHGIDNQENVYLVAFSGGFDSMCLLHSLKKITRNRIIAIHLNHNWRGEESNKEELNCKNFCSNIGVEFYCERLDDSIAHTETAAREARYNFFERCAKKFNSRIIFTAHNKNDNAETLIYRICKGTGISGLQGISENRTIYYRPLLNVDRNSIEKYCKDNNLSPNNDSSNSDTKYKRNFIRSEILPALSKINKNIVDSVNSLSKVAQEETEIIEEYLNLVLDRISKSGKIKTKEFLNLSEAMQRRIIYDIYTKNNLEYDREKILNTWRFIRENADSKSGKTCSLTSGLWIFTSDKYIEVISENTEELPYFHITKEGSYESCGYVFELEKFNGTVEQFPDDSEKCIYANLKNFPLNFEVRPRKEGDIIFPLGASGTQKLKKYLNSKKIPNHEKDNLLFMAQENEILWAIGLGISDKIKVAENPTHIIRLCKY